MACWECYSNPCRCVSERQYEIEERFSQFDSWVTDLMVMEDELRQLQSLKVALLTARRSASVDKLLKVLPILQREAFRGTTPELFDAQNKALKKAYDDLEAEIRAEEWERARLARDYAWLRIP